MRLINCSTLQLESDGDWAGPTPPPYAILSHTWAVDGSEVTLQEYEAGRDHAPRKDWTKIDRTVALARRQGLSHVWIDSCCIDKTNNAELSEAINSMFKWYAAAAVCYANLQDFDVSSSSSFPSSGNTGDASTPLDDSTLDPHLAQQLARCRWFRRGWTLQELIAPAHVEFYDRSWAFVGTRDGLSGTLSRITNIDRDVLASPSPSYPGQGQGQGRPPRPQRNLGHVLSRVPVARKMSWASARETKKVEDEAYALLGVFGVNMPMMYGEGDQAFIRLQDEILRTTNDMTIFAWTETTTGGANGGGGGGGVSSYRGVLAQSPREFAAAGGLAHSVDRRVSPVYTMTNKGLQIRTRLMQNTGSASDLMLMSLNCHDVDHRTGRRHTRGILLRFQGAATYVRAQPDRLEACETFGSGGGGGGGGMEAEKDIYITKNVTGPPLDEGYFPPQQQLLQHETYQYQPAMADINHNNNNSDPGGQLLRPSPPATIH